MRLFSLLLASFLTVACGSGVQPPKAPPPPAPTASAEITFHGPFSAPEELKYKVQKAADIWAIQTRGLAKIEIIWDDSAATKDLPVNHLFLLDSKTQEGFDKLHEDCGNNLMCMLSVVGLTTSGGIHNQEGVPVELTLFYDRMMPPFADYDTTVFVALHEMGHALGLPHTDASQAVMYPVVHKMKNVCLTKPDLALFCQVNECEDVQPVACE